MTATTVSHMGRARRHVRIIHFPDDYSLGPVFIRDRDEAAATLRTWRRTFAGWRGYYLW